MWAVNVRDQGTVNPPIPSIGQGPADPLSPFGGHLGTAALWANQEQDFKFCFSALLVWIISGVSSGLCGMSHRCSRAVDQAQAEEGAGTELKVKPVSGSYFSGHILDFYPVLLSRVPRQ